ncbi:MAG: BatD family protein [Bacteriovorax sp.]|nr:BatD family protein [Bacteriovorax sp.]
MKIFILLLMAFISNALFADDVDVVVEPKEGVVNESFFVTFKIKATGSEEPYISFTPYGASVLGKRSQGLSISTIVINGKFTTTKEQAVVYELLAEREGQVYLRNIKVEMSGKTIPVKEVRINVLKEPKRVPDAFIEAEASKTKVYLGEGLDVNYYLYFKTSISANDVKEFPKLNKFIKRFHHINSPVETVQYKGQVLKRILAYSARLYPEKTGNAVLDPMKISVQMIENEYGGFGFGNQRYKNKDLSSPTVEIEVLPLPTEGVPASFTGLVGEHEFNFIIPKSKYLVNEPIEIKLEAKGKGAVENFDAPVIFTDNNLEAFDTKSEVTEIGTQAAKKLFEYTMLARGPVRIAAREMALAYFDPGSGRYIEKKISIPALEVSGQAIAATGSNNPKPEALPVPEKSDENGFLNLLFKDKKEKAIEHNQVGLAGPNLIGQGRWFDKGFLVLNSILAFALVIIGVHWGLSGQKSAGPTDQIALVKRDISHMKKKGLNYSELYRVLGSLDKTNKMSSGGISIINVINDSGLAGESKEYFKNALTFTEDGSFTQSKSAGGKRVTFEKKHFNELLKHL